MLENLSKMTDNLDEKKALKIGIIIGIVGVIICLILIVITVVSYIGTLQKAKDRPNKAQEATLEDIGKIVEKAKDNFQNIKG